jgi:hypothetical protein
VLEGRHCRPSSCSWPEPGRRSARIGTRPRAPQCSQRGGRIAPHHLTNRVSASVPVTGRRTAFRDRRHRGSDAMPIANVASVGRRHPRVPRPATVMLPAVGHARAEPIAGPLPHIAGHVEQAVAVRRKAADWRGPQWAVSVPTVSGKSTSCSEVAAVRKVYTVRPSRRSHASALRAAFRSAGNPCSFGACQSSASPLKPISCRRILCSRCTPARWLAAAKPALGWTL